MKSKFDWKIEKKKLDKENAKKPSSSRTSNGNANVYTQDTTACMFCEIEYCDCESTVEWFKCKVCQQWACSECAHL